MVSPPHVAVTESLLHARRWAYQSYLRSIRFSSYYIGAGDLTGNQKIAPFYSLEARIPRCHLA
jgi:hypothetical protein